MRDKDKTKAQLIEEIVLLRRQTAALEARCSALELGSREPFLSILQDDNTDITQKQGATAEALFNLNERLLADATRLAKAGETLRVAKDQLESVLAAVPGMVSWISADLHYLGVNDHLAELFGLSPDDFIGQDIGFLGAGSDFNNFVEDFFKSPMRDRFGEIVSSIDGTSRHYLIVAQKYNRDRAAFIVGIDITKRQQTLAVLQRLATFDGLTQIANRRCFDETLEREWRRMMRDEEPLSLILCDVDRFKSYNDTYGHQAGDDCLQKIAAAMAEAAQRPGDLVARYGGEEFGLILPSTPSYGAVTVAKNIRKSLKGLKIPHEQVRTGYVTVSFGISSLIPTTRSSFAGLLEAADRALYQAKAEGRDRIVVSSGLKPE
ncbi:MAG: diguanylate cyclase [Cyanobacteria bacterium P01_E01_bin.42]